MNPSQPITCKRSMMRYTWAYILLAFLAFCFFAPIIHQTPSTPLSSGEAPTLVAMSSFLILSDVLLIIELPATLELEGSVLTLQKRKLLPTTKRLDLSAVTRIDVYTYGRGRTVYGMQLFDQAGHQLKLDFSGYPMKERLALLPALQELCNRAGIQKNQDDITKALNSWFKQ